MSHILMTFFVIKKKGSLSSAICLIEFLLFITSSYETKPLSRLITAPRDVNSSPLKFNNHEGAVFDEICNEPLLGHTLSGIIITDKFFTDQIYHWLKIKCQYLWYLRIYINNNNIMQMFKNFSWHFTPAACRIHFQCVHSGPRYIRFDSSWDGHKQCSRG